MLLAKIFDEAIEDLEVVNLQNLIVALCAKGKEYNIKGKPDELKFLKIVRILLGLCDYRIRVYAGEHVADMSGLPDELYLYFACDDIRIARLFLAPGFPLSSESILHIARHTTMEHRLELVKRPDLSPEVVQEILRANEPQVIRVMNQNEAVAWFYEYDDALNVDKDLRDMLSFTVDDDGEKAEKASPLDTMVKMFAEKSRFVDLIELLARQGQLPKETVKGLFGQKEVEPISILCRGLGIGDEAFAVLARFRCRRLGQLERLADKAIESYPDIEDSYAKAMVVDLQGSVVRMVRAKAAL